MKKNLFKFGFAAIALAAAASCSQDEFTSHSSDAEVIEATVITPEGVNGFAQRRSVVVEDGGDFALWWAAGEEIGVYGSNFKNTKYTSSNDKKAQTVTFTGGSLLKTPKYAYYPYSSANSSVAQTAVKGQLPQTQSWDASAPTLAGDYKIGTYKSRSWSTTTFTFSNVLTYVKMAVNASGTVLEGDKLQSVTMTVNSSTGAARQLWGAFTANLTKSDASALTWAGTEKNLNVATLQWTKTPALAAGSSVTGYMAAAPLVKKGDVINFEVKTANYKAAFSVTSEINYSANLHVAYSMPLAQMSNVVYMNAAGEVIGDDSNDDADDDTTDDNGSTGDNTGDDVTGDDNGSTGDNTGDDVTGDDNGNTGDNTGDDVTGDDNGNTGDDTNDDVTGDDNGNTGGDNNDDVTGDDNGNTGDDNNNSGSSIGGSDIETPVTPTPEVVKGQFTCATYNVDGLPKKISLVTINSDGPGADGTKNISAKIATQNWDFVGFSEDFEYHSNLTSSLGSYQWGKHRGSISSSALYKTLDTDGLEFAARKATCSWSAENITAFTSSYGGLTSGANTCIKKGFRHYPVTVAEGVVVDVVITHMNTYSSSGSSHINAQHAQLKQLAQYINSLVAKNNRPVILMGDTNCRYTRHDFKTYFWDVLDSYLTYADPWVDFQWGGVYPTYPSKSLMVSDATGTDSSTDIICADTQKGEVVDKIIYINNPGAPVQIKAQSYLRDYNNFKGLADHMPIVAPFEYSYTK